MRLVARTSWNILAIDLDVHSEGRLILSGLTFSSVQMWKVSQALGISFRVCLPRICLS